MAWTGSIPNRAGPFFLHRTLISQNWNISRAAEELGVTRQNLHMMIQKYGLDKAQKIYRDKKFDSFRSPRCYSFHNFSVLTSKVIDNMGVMIVVLASQPRKLA